MQSRRGEQLVVARAGLIQREVGDQLFLLLPDGTMHWLKNASAVALWKALVEAGADGVRSDALARMLSAAFVVDGERAAEDTERFVAVLTERGLARVTSDDPTPGA